MKNALLTYIVVLGSYLVLDFIWLGLVSQQSYQEAIGHLMRENIPKWPWITFYLIYSFVVVKLVVLPINTANHPSKAFVNGALFGLAAYAAYNLTNYAILASWPLSITIKDWAWGTFVSATIALVGFVFYRYLKNRPD